MGYRSNVEFIIRGPVNEMAKVWVLFKMDNAYHDSYDPLGVENLVVSEDRDIMVVHFRAEDWKWYESYDDIQRVETLWSAYQKASKKDGSKIEGGFARTGEDDEDIESRSFGDEGHNLVRVSRAICAEYDFRPEDDVRSKL